MASLVKVWLALVIIQLGYGGYGVIVAKFVVKHNRVNPVLFSFARLAGAFPVLLLTSAIFEKGIQLPRFRDAGLFLVLGLTGTSLNILLCVLGIIFTNANIATIFQTATPVWTALLAMVTRIEPIPSIKSREAWAKIIGITMAVSGAVVIMIHHRKGPSFTQFRPSVEGVIGCCLLLGNTFCMATYVLMQKKFIFNNEDSPWRNKPIAVTAWSYLVGMFSMGMGALYCINQPGKLTFFPEEQIYPILYAIFVASFLCDMLTTWCNMQISSSVVTATFPLQVLVSVILSYVILEELLNGMQYLGGGLIIFGLVGVVWSNYSTELEHKETALHGKGYTGIPSREEVVLSKDSPCTTKDQ